MNVAVLLPLDQVLESAWQIAGQLAGVMVQKITCLQQ